MEVCEVGLLTHTLGTKLATGETEVSPENWEKAMELANGVVKEMALFEGAKVVDGEVVVNPDIVYPKYLKELGYTKLDQTKLEIARLCFTKDLHKMVSIQGVRQLRLHILKGSGKWKLSTYPPGETLTMDLIAREYKKIRGDI